MSVSTPSRIEQREQLVEKLEQAVTHKAQLGNQGFILHFRIILRDLPPEGSLSLLLDDHRQAINKQQLSASPYLKRSLVKYQAHRI